MTVLSAIQAATARVVGRTNSAAVTSQQPIDVEMVALANEAAIDIARAHDWQALIREHVVAGNGDEDHPLPPDYDRMVKAMGVRSPSWPEWYFSQAESLDRWSLIKTRDFNLEPGWWIILGGRFHTMPVLGTGQEARFWYVSNHLFLEENGTTRKRIGNDNDTFRLSERLLTLSLIWRWRQMKQMDYAEDMRSYEMALSQDMANDKGPQIIRRNGAPRWPNTVRPWPWELGH